MEWIKKGQIFKPDGQSDILKSYAQVPYPVELPDKLRIYFTSRPAPAADGSFVSYIFFIDVDKSDFSKILYIHKTPVLELGGKGAFDEFGTMPGCVLHFKERGEFWLYYQGWTRMHSVPYAWANGLAISTDDGYNFKKKGRGPIIGATVDEPYLQTCPRVYKKDNNTWLMWYVSGLDWCLDNNKMESIYVIMFAHSTDGIKWIRDAKPIISSVVENECQICPTVIELGGTFHMYFSYRQGTNFRNKEYGYRMGYASSTDGLKWIRDDSKANLGLSNEGWDSEMVCYPYVTKIENKIYMFYCGNYFGKEGFGYALLENPK